MRAPSGRVCTSAARPDGVARSRCTLCSSRIEYTRLRQVRAVIFIGFVLTLEAQGGNAVTPGDQSAFRSWFTFLAESRYYARKPLREIRSGASLVGWAFHQALVRHDAAWSRSVELPVLPVMPSVEMPWVPRATATERGSDFPEEPDLRQYNAAFVSRRIGDIAAGDLLVYRNFALPSHIIVYVGASRVLPSPRKWVVYYDPAGKVHRIALDQLLSDPSPSWRPTEDNPEFLGIWRLEILRD